MQRVDGSIEVTTQPRRDHAVVLDAPPRDVFEVGDVLAETYEITRLLGAGGMGQVYEAVDRALNRKVAIKAHYGHMRAFSLRKEAQALAAIRHPAIATVYGIGKHGESEYVVMERIWGVSLAEHFARARRAGLPLPIAEVIELLAALADGLAAVHNAGIAHRDVKPSNVMLGPRGRIVLMDFGIMLPEYAVVHEMPSPGTAEYMAPEAISRGVTPGGAYLVDVYALGVLGYEALAGQLPFSGGGALNSVLMQHLRDAPPSLAKLRPDTPRKLLSLIEACLAKSPSDRPQSMDVIASFLRGIDTSKPDAEVSKRPFSVLVVDDDRTCASILAEIVRDAAEDAHVEVVHDGESALAALLQSAPDLLVLDLGLPGMNGLELCMYLRGARVADRTRIVSVSAGAQAHDVALLHQLGIRNFIRKGDRLVDQLDGVVREVLALR